ncbi:hypothetical protein PIIN_06626 [Serendipita indica DSM 11827]|uniref:Uncharacterized protein n=1 Tax=Serendipita indica (strain DSM 11827) TaxID=1109443 RepID=G4TMZ6_SERID|nr:hypothetical protein PIIN_06626 [Serendipita indica DSM 11827]
MGDYVRATQLQQLLKKRIMVLMKQKEAESAHKEDEARRETRELTKGNQELKEKILQLEMSGQVEHSPSRQSRAPSPPSEDRQACWRYSPMSSPMHRHRSSAVSLLDSLDLYDESPTTEY